MKDTVTFFHALCQDLGMLCAGWALSVYGVVDESGLKKTGEPERGGVKPPGNDFLAIREPIRSYMRQIYWPLVAHSLSRVQLFCDPMDHSLPGSSVHGIF